MRLPRSLALLLTAGLLAIGQPVALAADGANGLVQGEVFLDDPELDPGTGTPLVLSGEATDALRIGAGELDLTGVEPGSHTLYLRFQDQAGRWSAPLGQSFYVTEGNPGSPLPGGQNQVVAAEAFVDLDPGEGNAVPLATAADGAIDSAAEILSGTVPLTGVGIGVHVLNTRTLDSTGIWSPPTRQTFFVPALADGGGGNPVILVAAEGIVDGGPSHRASGGRWRLRQRHRDGHPDRVGERGLPQCRHPLPGQPGPVERQHLHRLLWDRGAQRLPHRRHHRPPHGRGHHPRRRADVGHGRDGLLRHHRAGLRDPRGAWSACPAS